MSVLQISPYIYCLKNNKVYSAITEKGYPISEDELNLLEYCRGPRERKELIEKYGNKTVMECIEKDYLVSGTQKWELKNVRYAEIETSTQCNWKCLYCPVSVNKREYEVMSLELYNKIIDELSAMKTIKYILLNIYNEPTLDKFFNERIIKLAETDIKLELCTNGSHLDEDKLRLLKSSGVLHEIRFHLPSVDEGEFKRITGSNTYNQTISNIENAIRNNFKIIVLVNGNLEEIQKNLPEVTKKFGHYPNVEIHDTQVTDRAGTIKNYYSMNIHIKGNLYGCSHQINCLHIKANGQLVICCADYNCCHTYGDVKKDRIVKIINDEKAKQIRKKVFGEESAPDDFICRKCVNMKFAKVFKANSKK